MKRMAAVIVALGLLAGGAWAQTRHGRVSGSFGFGAVTNTEFGGVLLSLAPRMDLALSNSIGVTVECAAVTNILFSNVLAFPGALLNLTNRRGAFVGAGLVVPVYFSDNMEMAAPWLKLHAGIKSKRAVYTVYLLQRRDGFDSVTLLGATIGIGF